jgi:hypothetical protein
MKQAERWRRLAGGGQALTRIMIRWGSAPNPGSSLAGTPSRSSIGAHLQLLEDAGYKTAIVGKWQLSERDFQASFHFGFEEYLLWHFGMRVIGVQTPGSQGSRYGPGLVSLAACPRVRPHRGGRACTTTMPAGWRAAVVRVFRS